MMMNIIDVKHHRSAVVVCHDAIQHHPTVRTLGERLLYAMKLRKIGFNELDRAIGQSSGYVSRLAGGKKQQPDVFLVNKIAHELQIDFEWLVSGRGSAPLVEGGPHILRPLSQLPGWPEAIAEARQRYKSIPEAIWQETAQAVLPSATEATWERVGRVAQILFDTSPGQPLHETDKTAPFRRQLEAHPPTSSTTPRPGKGPPKRNPGTASG